MQVVEHNVQNKPFMSAEKYGWRMILSRNQYCASRILVAKACSHNYIICRRRSIIRRLILPSIAQRHAPTPCFYK